MKNGWQKKKLGEVCNLMTGGTPSRGKPEYFGGNIRWLVSGDIHAREIFDCEGRITNEGMNNSNAKLLPINSVMIALNGQGKTRGSVALLRTEATCNQSLVCIIPKEPAKLLPEFLYANLHGRYQEIRYLTSDADNDRRGLNMPIIRDIDIPIAPIEEQQRIVSLLDEAFEGIATAKANAEKNLQNARALFESHLQSVFTHRGPGWVDRPLDAVSSILNGHAFKSTDFDTKVGTKCIKITNVGVREFVCNSDGFLPVGFAEEYKKVSVKAGSIVIALTRTIISGGLKVSIVPEEYNGALLNQRVAALVANETILSSGFLFSYLSTQLVVEYVREKVNTLMQPNLSIADLRAMPIPLPPPAEQEAFNSKIEFLSEETQRITQIYQKKIAALDELKKALLHKAFSGEL
ncbi:MAG: restriction endonuclease subunit S [Gammaproteobacteria bacterium]|nr:restriction endonuclease subunit S [Gammaproteobacteria bacterium]